MQLKIFPVHLTIWTINIYPLTILCKALLNIIGEKGAMSNINYYNSIIIIIYEDVIHNYNITFNIA